MSGTSDTQIIDFTPGYAPETTSLIEHVLAAEFDIDKGSSLSFEYPTPTNIDHTTLAEWMLPEGAHLRAEDVSYFILNRRQLNQSSAFEDKTIADKPIPPTTDSDEFSDEPRIVVLGMLYTMEKDSTWAHLDRNRLEWTICMPNTNTLEATSNDSSIQYSWNILGAKIQTLSPLFVWFPHLKPKNLGIRFRNVDDCAFIMHFFTECAQVESVFLNNQPIPPVPDIPAEEKPLLYVINAVSMKHISGARRSARVKSLALASRHPWVHVFKPLLVRALDLFFVKPEIQVLESLFRLINSLDVSGIPLLTFSEKKALRSIFRSPIAHSDIGFKHLSPLLKYFDPDDSPLELAEVPFEYEIPVTITDSDTTIPVKIPLAQFSTEFGDFSMSSFLNMMTIMTPSLSNPPPIRWKLDTPYSWHPHLDTGPLTHPFLILLSALLTEKRVLFIGHGKPSQDVSKCVLACAAIACGGDWAPDAINRVFPYTSLASLDQLLATPGYIAGVTNPVFEDQTAWWDVAFNLNTGKLMISPKCISNEGIERDKDREELLLSYYEEDDNFLQQVQTSLQQRSNEYHVRNIVYSYVNRIYQYASARMNGEAVRPLVGWKNRIDGIIASHTFSKRPKSESLQTPKSLFPHFNLRGLIHELNTCTGIPNDRVVSCYILMDHLVAEGTDEQLVEILSYLPYYTGAAVPFSAGLFHIRPEVRSAASRIIQRLFCQKIGDEFLNPFVKAALIRHLAQEESVAAYQEMPSKDVLTPLDSTSRPSTNGLPSGNLVLSSEDEDEDEYDTDSSDGSLNRLEPIMGSASTFHLVNSLNNDETDPNRSEEGPDFSSSLGEHHGSPVEAIVKKERLAHLSITQTFANLDIEKISSLIHDPLNPSFHSSADLLNINKALPFSPEHPLGYVNKKSGSHGLESDDEDNEEANHDRTRQSRLVPGTQLMPLSGGPPLSPAQWGSSGMTSATASSVSEMDLEHPT